MWKESKFEVLYAGRQKGCNIVSWATQMVWKVGLYAPVLVLPDKTMQVWPYVEGAVSIINSSGA